MKAKTLFEVTVDAIARKVAIAINGSDVAFKLYKNDVSDAMIKRLIEQELDKLDARFQELLTEVNS
jgi:hypothetical protein